MLMKVTCKCIIAFICLRWKQKTFNKLKTLTKTLFMKKLLLMTAIVSISLLTRAQSGNNQAGIAFELGVPTGDFGDLAKTGFGGLFRAGYGIGSAGQLTFTTGYTSFGIKDEWKDFAGVEDWNLHIIPFLAGYRHNFSGFYVEPQIGYGIYGSKATAGGVSESDSEGAFTYGGGLGYQMKGLEIGARYQAGSKDGETTSYIGFHIGYNFSLSGGAAK
jgi:hypothetical protein